jgi:N6-L-threonylcarbamoyladenine synthase
MRVLAIESSCDETSAAVLSSPDDLEPLQPGWQPRVEGHVVSSQIEMHKRWGGVVPELASRAHLEAVLPAIEEALKQAQITRHDLDFIAVTRGPGLVGALLMGVETAKALAFSWQLPIVGVHHLAGHILATYLSDAPPPELPFACLLVSGGHSALYRVDGATQFQLLGQTRDDAAGEAFDKGARMMGLPYPGGMHIDRIAKNGRADAFNFPIAMKHSGNTDMSFSGLKTALRTQLQKMEQPLSEETLADLCASYQEAIAQSLAFKTKMALNQTGLKHLVVAGGVAKNSRIRDLLDELCQDLDVSAHLVPLAYCTDNAAMIGAAALAAPQRAWLQPDDESALTMDANPAIKLDEPFTEDPQ